MIRALLNREASFWQKGIVILYFLLGIIVCFQLLHSTSNNFVIFTWSSRHLLGHQPLYQLYPQLYDDYFLYHPAFAVLFLPFSLLPYAVGVCAWTLLSTLLLLHAVRSLPGLATREKNLVLLFVLPEFINNLQYAQTNILLLALMLLVFTNFEKQHLLTAGLFTALCFCIKGYGGIIGLLFLLYPGKWKYLLAAASSTLLICLLPLLFGSWSETLGLYAGWLKMISSDEIRESMSVLGVARPWGIGETFVTAAGGLLLLFTLILLSRAKTGARLSLLSYLLVWVVLFNRAAESPTYQLALMGLGLWLAMHGFRGKWLLGGLMLILMVYLASSDLFPFIHQYFYDHQVKVLAFSIPFLLMQYEVFRGQKLINN